MGEVDEMHLTTLGEAIADLDALPSEATIFAVKIKGRWVWESPALVVPEQNGLSKEIVDGGRAFEYVLEVFIAQEVLEDWTAFKGGHPLPPEERLRVVVHYALYDACPVE